jgi:hypothetical protein
VLRKAGKEMGMRAGTYSKVTRVVPLADPGRKQGANVAFLSCGHARTCGHARKGQRLWCRICTIADAKAAERAPVQLTRAQYRTAIARAVAKALRRAGVKVPHYDPTDSALPKGKSAPVH